MRSGVNYVSGIFRRGPSWTTSLYLCKSRDWAGGLCFSPRQSYAIEILPQKEKEFARKIHYAHWKLSVDDFGPVAYFAPKPSSVQFFQPLGSAAFASVAPGPNVDHFRPGQGSFYRLAFGFQVLFYCFALIGSFVPAAKRFKPVAIATTFVMLNAAATLAFYNFIAGNKDVWVSSAST